MARPQRIHVNFWAFLQTVLTHSMNKGQFPGACVAGLLALLTLKLSAEQADVILHRLLEMIKSGTGISYSLNVVLLGAWAYHAKRQRTAIAEEMERMGREKSRLQEEMTGRKLTNVKKK